MYFFQETVRNLSSKKDGEAESTDLDKLLPLMQT